MNSRQRILRAINYQEVDYIPCSFMSFAIMRKRKHEDWYAVAREEKALGLDPMLFIPMASRADRREHPDLRGLPVRAHPTVRMVEWVEEGHTLHKEYQTPAGRLSTSIRLSEDWPHDKHIPFVDDYQIPRAIKPLVTGPDDLLALAFMLQPPGFEDTQFFYEEIGQARLFAEHEGVILAGGWGVGMDMANWLCGMENLMMFAIDQPEFVDQLLEIIHKWNLVRMRTVLSGKVDLFIRRAWYEGCDFITPGFFQQCVLPRLKIEVDLAHEYGANFGYICSSGTRPILDFLVDSGVDVLLGVDPVQGTYTDLPLMKQKLFGKVCVWGGTSAAVTVERGSEVQIRQAVHQAINILGPTGFILSPVDNLTIDEPLTWNNINIFIDEWKRNR